MTFRLMVLRFVGLFFRFIFSVFFQSTHFFLLHRKKQTVVMDRYACLQCSEIKEMNTKLEFISHLSIRVFGLWTQLHNPKMKRAKAMKFRNHCVIYRRKNFLNSHWFKFVMLLLYVISIKRLLFFDHFILI